MTYWVSWIFSRPKFCFHWSMMVSSSSFCSEVSQVISSSWGS